MSKGISNVFKMYLDGLPSIHCLIFWIIRRGVKEVEKDGHRGPGGVDVKG